MICFLHFKLYMTAAVVQLFHLLNLLTDDQFPDLYFVSPQDKTPEWNARTDFDRSIGLIQHNDISWHVTVTEAMKRKKETSSFFQTSGMSPKPVSDTQTSGWHPTGLDSERKKKKNDASTPSWGEGLKSCNPSHFLQLRISIVLPRLGTIIIIW